MRSVAFAQAIGVFEGGGVRGAAFAGAYRAATQAGINFVATVGTSSGSIAAAFISAGMNPDEVEQELKTDFAKLLRARSRTTRNRALRVVTSVLGKYSHMMLDLGMFSSSGIGEWVNETLQKKLARSHNPVRFDDLPKSLAIVATDLQTRGPKVWSRETTPDAPVSFAVRASCSIPLFFQPVDGESSFLVDGGLIANLPIFLASRLQVNPMVPVLAFRLVRDRATSEPPKTGLQLLRAAIDSTLNGATEVQLSLAGARQVIDISTGSVGATDFEISPQEVDNLVAAGKAAVEEFVKDEQVRVVSSPQQPATSVLGGFREGLLEDTCELIASSSGDVWIIGGGLTWIAELHVTLMEARLAGRNIRILTESRKTSEYAEALRGALAVGADIAESREHGALRATIVNPRSHGTAMVAIERDPELHGRVYKSPDDNAMLDVVQDAFERLWKDGKEIGKGVRPELLPLTTEEIVSSLQKGVRQYRDLSIAVRQVNVSELKPLPRFLEAFKLVRAAALDRLLARHGLTPGARVKNSPWIITPPVIEQLANGVKVIMDGTHRIYSAIQDGKSEVVVVLVQNPKPNLPAEPFADWQHIRILRHKVLPNDRYKNFNNQEFRSILTAFRALARIDERYDSKSRGELVIIDARYGMRDHRVDVTKQLNSAITGSKLHIYIGNQLAGDPCPNSPKDLFVKYRFKDQEFEKTINEGADLDLP